MTIKEKTGIIEGYCKNHEHCGDCPLHHHTIIEGNCYSGCTDKEIEWNFNLLFGQGTGGESKDALIEDSIPGVKISNAKNVYVNYTINHFEKLEEDKE